MKLEDPIAPYKGIVERHRRVHVAEHAACFRIGGPAPNRRVSIGPVALLGASGGALGPGGVETTVAYLGALGGLLADLGYDVFAISSLPHLDARVAFVAWVGGGEMSSERELLASLDTTVLAVGGELGIGGAWARIEPDDRPESIEFIGSALHEIRRLTDGAHHLQEAPERTAVSTVPSTARPGTGVYGTGQPGYDDPRNSSSRALSGAERDGLNGRSEGS